MKLKQLVKINDRFEKSVNLYLDLDNPNKIRYYIPTHSSIQLLIEFLRNTETKQGRSNVLIGPYGKGKSHLLLVLLTILRKNKTDLLMDLIRRISAVDENYGKIIDEVFEDERPFLPVVVHEGNGSLSEIMIKSLARTLKKEGLNDVVPDSYYLEAIKAIERWKNDFPDTYRLFENKVEDVDVFIRGLHNYDADSLSRFREIFPSLSAGSPFNPIIEEGAMSVYSSVNKKLCEEYGYAGIYIVFDEFSKYIEGHPVAGFAADMKTLQDICELCNASDDQQIHLTCVAHKSIGEYSNSLPKELIDNFKGVQGRLDEKKFIISPQNNYELIASAVEKTEVFMSWKEKDEDFQKCLEDTCQIPGFYSIFTEAELKKIVVEGCFPLTPVASMILLALSEKIAQNERTIFTYLTNANENGLPTAVRTAKGTGFIGADNIYDYFVPSFRDGVETAIYHEWLKAETALQLAETEEEKAIIKTICVIRMINRPDDIPCSDIYIHSACGISQEKIDESMETLLKKMVIRFKEHTKTYEFKNNIGVDVNSAIADNVSKYFKKADISSALDVILKEKEILPKKHNYDKKITRYFNYKFMTQEQFLKLNSKQYLESIHSPDGYVIMILPEDGLKENEIKKHTELLNDKCIIVCLPEKSEPINETVKEMLAVNRLKNDESFLKGEPVLKLELEDIYGEYVLRLNQWVKDTYYSTNKVFITNRIISLKEISLNRVVSDTCDQAFSLTPVFNHELINRHEPSSPIKKARNTIMQKILFGEDLDIYLKGSSAEATIYRAVYYYPVNDKGTLAVKQEIQNYISECADSKKCFAELIEKLVSPPYGMRRGIIPFLLVSSLTELGSMPVLYLDNKEIPVNLEAINNIVRTPEKYHLFIEKKIIEENDYLNGLEKIFFDYADYCIEIDKRNRLAKISCMMQSWYRSLPQYSVLYNGEDDEAKEINSFKKIFAQMHLNPREIIFDKIPKIFKCSDYISALKKVQNAKHEVDSYIHKVKEDVALILMDEFELCHGTDLKQGLIQWYELLPENTKISILSDKAMDLLSCIKGLESNDPERIAGEFGKMITGSFIEDWNSSTVASFKEELAEIITVIKNIKEKEIFGEQKVTFVTDSGIIEEKIYDYNEENLSTSGYFFKNALTDMMEEFDDSIETSEKIGILMSMVKDLINKN